MFYNIKALSLQVFFMVLDLRLRRLPVVMTSNFFLCLLEPAADVGLRNGGRKNRRKVDRVSFKNSNFVPKN